MYSRVGFPEPAPADHTNKPQTKPKVAELATREILRHALHGIGAATWLQRSNTTVVFATSASETLSVAGH